MSKDVMTKVLGELQAGFVGNAMQILREALAEQPAQRTWVGLTDEERFKVAEQTGCMSADWLDVIKATETALQIKNQ